MKLPVVPPSSTELLGHMSFDRYVEVAQKLHNFSWPDHYLHWDKLMHLRPPDGVTSEEWWHYLWHYLKIQRRNLYKIIPLRDKQDQPFRFLMTDPLPEELHSIDQSVGGRIGIIATVINPASRDQYYVSSLMEEAITSSQLEGAVTTRKVAKEMLLTQRMPIDRSERMIVNNFVTMQRISHVKDQPLTKELIFELHGLVTMDTLDDPTATGRFRRTEDDIVVSDYEGTICHIPPAAAQLEERMAFMCTFANGDAPNFFVHPVIRAIILHFWLAYDHPFVDGNGRTARALFYWSMLHQGYWLCEYLSISRIIKKARVQYERAFLYTETDDNDLTYFLIYHAQVIHEAISDLNAYVKRKVAEQQTLEQNLRGSLQYNHRQRVLISHALRHPNAQYTVEGHRTRHNIVYQTARTDLLGMAEQGLLEKRKVGKTMYFTPSRDMERKLRTQE